MTRPWTPRRIRSLRNKYGLSQVDFGYKILEMNITTVGRWERGECKPSNKAVEVLETARANSPERRSNANNS